MILRDIHLNRAQKTLIADGELPLEPGKTTVLFGPSGSGKSTLLYALGELDSFVELSTDAGACPLHCEHVGLVPQQSAVFEDFGSAGENIAFAHDHTACRNHDDLEAVLAGLEAKLGIDRKWRFPMSGGQKQRVAIARAIAGKATVLLCDEPTSGLDPACRQDAIRAIREAAHEGVAVLVVTHDQEWNHPEAADYAVVLRDGKLTEHAVGHAIDKSAFIPFSPSAQNPTARLNRFVQAFVRFGEAVWWICLFPVQIFRGFFGKDKVRPNWLLAYWLHYCRMTLGLSSLFYLVAGGLLVGFASLYFSGGGKGIPIHLQQMLKPELLSASGFGLYRVLIPLVAALLVAAKTGSAVAADIGSRQYGGQISVMRTLRANPETHLLFSIMLALAIGMPVLNMLAFGAAALGSLLAFLINSPGETVYAWRVDFLRLLQRDGFVLVGTGWNMVKLAVSGAGVGLIAYRCGIRAKSSHTDIGRDISSASLWTSLWCLGVLTLFALWEF